MHRSRVCSEWDPWGKYGCCHQVLNASCHSTAHTMRESYSRSSTHCVMKKYQYLHTRTGCTCLSGPYCEMVHKSYCVTAIQCLEYVSTKSKVSVFFINMHWKEMGNKKLVRSTTKNYIFLYYFLNWLVFFCS